MDRKQPHIVIFNPDSYRGDVLGHLGNAAAVTPHVDALVRQGGVSYANAFAQNPVCTPSRCSFMTGLYVHARGHRSMKHMLREHEPHLLKVLMREGYKVWWGGKNDLAAVTTPEDYLQHCHIKAKPAEVDGAYTSKGVGQDDHRFNAFYRGPVDGRGRDWPFIDKDSRITREAVRTIEAHDADEQPLCMFMPLGNPHPAYFVERDFYDMIDPAKLPARLGVPDRNLPALDQLREAYGSSAMSEDDWREIQRVYYAMCAKVDALLGQVVTALKNKGIYDNTLIIFMSDHGDFTGDYGLVEKTHFTLQDNLLRVPLVIKPPANINYAPGVRKSLVELVDMCPTIYNLLNIQPGYDTQGQSLRDSLAGDDAPTREHVFAQVGARKNEAGFINTDVHAMDPTSFYARQSKASHDMHRAGSHAVMVRSDRYKLIHWPYLDRQELYDLQADPGELHDLSDDPAMVEVKQSLDAALLRHYMLTADVLPHEQDSRKV